MPRVIVVYDISDNRVREEFAKFLQAHGLVRVQRSMFIGRVSSQTLKDIERKASKTINFEKDVVHIVPLSIYEYQHMRVIGTPFTSLREAKTYVIL